MYHIPCPSHSFWPSPRSCKIFCKIANCYCEKLLVPRPKPNWKDHTLSAIRDCFLNTFAATLHIWMPFFHLQPEDAPIFGDRDPLIIVEFLLWRQHHICLSKQWPPSTTNGHYRIIRNMDSFFNINTIEQLFTTEMWLPNVAFVLPFRFTSIFVFGWLSWFITQWRQTN